MKVFFEFPLLKREFVSLLRTRRAVWLALFLVALASLLPLLTWPTGKATISTRNQEVFLTFAMTQLVVGLLIIPAFTAGAISGERERGTFEMLYTTLLSPWSIIISKVSASVGYVTLILIATAPSLCVLLLIGGLGYESVMACYAITFLSVVSSGIVCLAVSLRSKTTAQAVVRGFIWTIFWNGGLALSIWIGTMLLVWLTGLEAELNRLSWLAGMWGMSPFVVMPFEVFSPDLPFGLPVPLLLIYTVYVGIYTAIHLVFLLRNVRMPDLARPRSRRILGLARRRQRAARSGPVRRPAFSDFLLELGDDARRFIGNPVFRKELRSEFFGRLWYRRILFWLPLLLFLLVTWIVADERPSDPELSFLWVGNVTLALMFILLPAVSASSIPREIEQGNMDLLRGTLVSLRSVLNGKYLAGVFSIWGLYAAAFLSLVPVSGWYLSRGPRHHDAVAWGLIVTVATLIGTLLFCVALANLFSALSKKTVTALLLTYITLIAVLIGIPILSELLPYSTRRGMEPFFEATNPFWLFSESITDFSGFRPKSFAANGERFLVFMAVQLGGAAALWFAAGAALTKLRSRD